MLLVSFVALSLLWKRAYFETDAWRALSRRISRLIVNPLTEFLAGTAGVFLLAVVVWSGLSGTEFNDRNFAPTFVFITCWLGVVLLSVLFGDVFEPSARGAPSVASTVVASGWSPVSRGGRRFASRSGSDVGPLPWES